MAGESVKISELPELTNPHSADVLIVNDSTDNTTKKMSFSSFKSVVEVDYTPIAGLSVNTSDGKLHGNLQRITAGIYCLGVGNGGFTVTNSTANPINLEFECSNSAIIGMSEVTKSIITSQMTIPTASGNNQCSVPIIRVNTNTGRIYFQSLQLQVVQSGANFNSNPSVITVPANSTAYFYNGLYADTLLLGNAFKPLQ